MNTLSPTKPRVIAVRSRLITLCILLVILSTAVANPQSNTGAALSEDAVLIDVRTAIEFKAGHISGAVNIPHEAIVPGLQALNIKPDTPVVLYCRSGNRSGIAASSLKRAGFTQVTNAGGYKRLQAKLGERLQEN